MELTPLFALSALAIGAVGVAVRNLQALLARLNIREIPQEELANQAYREGTTRAVRALQERLNLQAPRPGEVDEATARAVNEHAFETGVFFIVMGRVMQADGTPAASKSIRVVDVDNLDLPCAEVTTDAQGHYLAFYDPAFYQAARPGVVRRKEPVDVVVRVHEASGEELVRSATLPRPGRRVTVDLTIGQLVVTGATGLRVRGTVVDGAGHPLEGIEIDVYDRDVGRDRQRLGERDRRYRTDADGRFEIPYDVSQFEAEDIKRDGKPTADLIFRISQDGRDLEPFQIVRLPIDEDDVISGELPFPQEEQILGIPARDDEFVTLIVSGATVRRGPSEYERLLEALSPLTIRHRLAEFDEAGSRDVTFAAREIGWDVDQVADIVGAHRLTTAAFANVPPAVLYGLARTLGAREPRQIAMHRVNELRSALERAVAAAMIAPVDGDIGRIAADVHATAVREALAVRMDGAAALNDVIGAALPDATVRAQWLAAAVNHAGDPAQFWTTFAAANPTINVQPIQYALHLDTLTGRNVPLMTALQQKVPAATSIRSLAFHLDEAALADIVRDSGAMPATLLDGETHEAARARLVGEVSGLLEAAQPTAVVARLAKGWHTAAPQTVDTPAADLLTRAALHTDFDLATGSVDALIDKHGAMLFDGNTDAATRATAVDGVKRIQRLFHVSSDPKTLGMVASVRSSAGLPFRGALDIARFSKPAFLVSFKGATAEQQQALSFMHDRSRAVADTVAQLIIGQHQDVRDAKPAAADGAAPAGDGAAAGAGGAGAGAGPGAGAGAGGGGGAGSGAVPATGDQIPSWADFFGGAEVCECEECRSVVGPAAYVVDLLEFLDKRCAADPDNGVTPLDVLIGHPTKTLKPGDPPGIAGLRPDLAHFKLSCENTNTTIPTVDLINEILESVVAFSQTTPLAVDSTGATVSPPELVPNESSPGVTGPELSAAPENVLEAAYEKVGTAVFPISLPYNRLIATARANIAQAGSTRAEVIRLFSPLAAEKRAARAAADVLNLLERDVEILAGTTFDGGALPAPIRTKVLYGEPDGGADWTTKTLTAREALTALQLSFEDLVALLRTRFVGGEVPTGNEAEVGSRLFLTVAQLATLRAAAFVPDDTIALALERGGLSADDVKAFVAARAARLATTIVLDPPMSCDPDAMELRHLDDSEVAASEWLAIHRLARLARRSRLSIAELDVALFALTPAGTQPDFSLSTLQRLAQLRELARSLDLPVAVTASLVGTIDTHGPSSLYSATFGTRALTRLHPLFRRDQNGEVLTANAPIADAVPGLAAALSESPAVIADVVKRLALTTLDLASLSEVHRVVVLARALSVSPRELIRLRSALVEPAPAGTAGLPLATLVRFVERARRVMAAEFDPATLAYLSGTGSEAGDNIGRSDTDLGQIIDTLPAALAPHLERDARERAEEAALLQPGSAAAATPPPAYTPEQIAARIAEGHARRETAAVAHLAQHLAMDTRTVARLVTDQLVAGVKLPAVFRTGAGFADPAVALFAMPVTAANRAGATAVVRGLDRVSVLLATTQLDHDALTLATGAAGLLDDAVISSFAGSPDPKATLEAIDRLSRFAALAADPKRPAALSRSIKALVSSTGNDWSDETFTAVAQWLDVSAERVKRVPRTIAPELDLAIAKKAPVEALSAMKVRLAVAGRLGLQPDQIADVTAEPITPAALERLVAGVRSHYDATTWLDVSRQLADPIRESSRDALVAFLLKRDGLRHADDLFSKYLIDTQTNAFVLTSRIRQAMFAIQIYVQRCRMGLMIKQGVRPEQIDSDEWETIGRLPLFAARLKGLLWPEELLNPSWRDDKTKLFREFESTIRQADVTPANAARAYATYLDDFRVIASLEICGTFLQTFFEGREEGHFVSVLHVVGRTRGGVPRKYFYRRLNRHLHYEEWTGWEPVTADIQGIERDRPGGRKQGSDDALYEAGVHVLPVVWRGQLHLFWPTMIRKVDQPADAPTLNAQSPSIKARISEPYWEVKLCWTRRDGETWTPKEQSSALVETWWYPELKKPSSQPKPGFVQTIGKVKPQPHLPDPNKFVLKANVKPNESLEIRLALRGDRMEPVSRFAFSFDRVASEMVASKISGTIAGDHPSFAATGLAASYMGLTGSGALSVTSPKKPEGDRLFTAPRAFRITTLNQSFAVPTEAPFFIGYDDKTYFATTSPGTTTAREEIAAPAPAPKPLPFIEGTAANAYSATSLATMSLQAQLAPNPWTRAAGNKVAKATAAVKQSFATPATAALQLKPALEIDKRIIERVGPSFRTIPVETVNVAVTAFYHPFADRFATTLKRDGLDALLTPEMQRLKVADADTFAGACQPNPERVKAPTSEGIDFDTRSAYGIYNWELFFHAPMVLAQRLAENNQLDAAREVMAKVFDPLAAGSDPENAWKFEGLRGIKSMNLGNLLALLSRPDGDPEKREVLAQVEAMRLYPFQAHRIARLRPVAYRKWTVAQSVKLGLALGDRHFRRFTPEDVNYAIQPYLICAAQMGRRPEKVPPRVTMPSRTYAELRPDLDALGNVFFEAEIKLAPFATGTTTTPGSPATGVLQRGAIGYFGIPKNDKMLALWDEVEDRLFKIRNGMNIEGIQIQLPLFPPAIDPALLAQAVAAGLSISDVVDALSAPRPHYKFRPTHRQAVELAELVVRIGAALTAAREKRDTEELARLRVTHEKTMAAMLRQLRDQQVAEAQANRDAILADREAPMSRWSHYRDLLGAVEIKPPGPDPDTPTTINTGRAGAKRPLNLIDASTVGFEALAVIPAFARGLANLAPGVAVAGGLAGDTGGITLAGGNILVEEKQELEASFSAVRTTFEAAALDMLASMFNLIPNFEAAVKPFGAGAAIHFGGQALAAQVSAVSRNKHAEGAMHNFISSVYGKQAGFVLREREWVAQLNAAAADVLSIDRKLILANLQVASAIHQQAMQVKAEADTLEIETHLLEKFSSLECQDFQISQGRQLFKRFFDMALERVKAAAQAYAAERGVAAPPVSVARSGNPRFELMAGYELLACLADMDRSWVASAALGPQLERSISLKQLNPWALHNLRETGEAVFTVPELLFDLDHPGDYDRRIRSVQVTIPCVAGAYAPVTGTLTLLSSRRRKKPVLGDGAVETDAEPGQPSISLSSGREDAGLFELSLHDELFLPCEGRGLDSTWKLRLPQKHRHFNYRTAISDVILTFRYVSRRGGEKFGSDVSDQIAAALNKLKLDGQTDGPYQLVSVRHDFPDAWYRYQAGQGLSVNMAPDILPYVLRSGMKPKLEQVRAVSLPKDKAADPAQDKPVVADGSGWKIDVAAAGPPAALDDIYLLARFKMT